MKFQKIEAGACDTGPEKNCVLNSAANSTKPPESQPRTAPSRRPLDNIFDTNVFDGSMYPDAPGHRGVSTSIEASDALAPKLGRLQVMVLGFVRDQGQHGATADECAAGLSLDRWSIQPRTSELRRKGKLVDSGQRRRNETGKKAIVWVTPEHKGADDEAR